MPSSKELWNDRAVLMIKDRKYVAATFDELRRLPPSIFVTYEGVIYIPMRWAV